ncbi:MAG: class III extradiol ring-cleavage dioxygenase [Eubacteriales bacterium]
MDSNKSQKGAQIIYFSHGGGPLPILGDPSHAKMNEFMKKLPEILRKPEAIILFSAHWEENIVTLQTNAAPPMLYDYFGFPAESYEIKYPAKNSPEFLKRIKEILEERNIKYKEDDMRGYDHGHFIPLKMMYPDADIPTFQISMLHSLSAKEHINLGNALNKLKDENVLIIGSGFSFHNLRAFGFEGNTPDDRNDTFQDWLIKVCTGEATDAEKELINWESAPNARYCHPREEHLLPLHVCQGAAKCSAKVIFDDYIAGKRAVAFLWE